METYEIVGYAHWANYILTGERDNNTDSRDVAEINAWLAANDVSSAECIDVRNEASFGTPEGVIDALPGMVCEFVFICR